MMQTLLRAALLIVIAVPAAAQTPASVAGTYEIDYPVRMAMINGEPGEPTMAKVKLVLEVKGDSAIATWQLTGAPREVPAQTLRGTWKGNTVKLSGVSQARIRGNGEEQQISMQQEYDITVDGDTIKGSITTIPPDNIMINMAPRTFNGKRVTT